MSGQTNGTTMTELATPTEQKMPVALNGRLGNLDQAWRISTALAQSALLPQALRNKPSDVLVTILYGQEIGLSAMQSLQSIYVVNGRPTMSGQLWLAKVRQAGHKVEVHATDKEATCTITRRDDPDHPHTEVFTWADAEKAKLTGKDVWKSYPKRMLGWRAVSNCATITCPEVALGFEVTELAQADEPTAKPTLAQVAAQRVDTETGEVHDAELVDDDAVRREVEKLAQQHTEPTDAEIAAMAAEMTPDGDDTPPSGLFGGDS